MTAVRNHPRPRPRRSRPDAAGRRAERQEIKLANAIISATSPDAPPVWWPEGLWPGWRLKDLCEIMVHVIAETACHAGHLDAVRELIDGRTWMILT
jgi:hypothetical protein